MFEFMQRKGQALRAMLVFALLLAGCGSSVPADTESSVVPGVVKSDSPPLTASEADMAAALHCPEAFTSSFNPVLLVHGTGANADVAYDSGLVPVLAQRGYDACTVDLPHYSWGDIQIAAEYVVYGVRMMAQRSGRHVALVGHSQGVLELGWALKWWPDVDALVDDSIGISGVYHGVDLANNVCAAHVCMPSAWQMDRGSNFMAALLRDDETPGRADYSSLFSTTDGTAYPSAVLEYDASIAVQDICPGREVAHSHMLFDAVSVALVLDALSHAGPADPARIDRALCAQDVAEGIDAQEASYKESVAGGLLYGATIADAGVVLQEPALAPYVNR